jgi:hypothetical protein
VRANLFGEATSVNTIQSRDAVGLEPLAQAAVAVPVAVLGAVVAHNEAGNVDVSALKMSRESHLWNKQAAVRRCCQLSHTQLASSHLIDLILGGNTIVSHKWVG